MRPGTHLEVKEHCPVSISVPLLLPCLWIESSTVGNFFLADSEEEEQTLGYKGSLVTIRALLSRTFLQGT